MHSLDEIELKRSTRYLFLSIMALSDGRACKKYVLANFYLKVRSAATSKIMAKK